jgi:hypothetical protein
MGAIGSYLVRLRDQQCWRCYLSVSSLRKGERKVRLKRYFLLLSLISLLVVIGLSNSVLPVSSAEEESNQIEKNFDFEPPNTGTVSGSGTEKKGASGSRNPNDNFIVLVPVSGEGFTYTARPTFWLYFAEAVDSQAPLRVSLSLQDTATAGETYAYQGEFQLDQSPGLFHIQLPFSALPLAIGTEYQWDIKVLSNQLEAEAQGAIARSFPSSEIRRQLAQASPREKIGLYGQNGIWFDFIDQVASLLADNPNDLELLRGWNQVLANEEVKLRDRIEVEKEKFLSCCSPVEMN